MGFAVGVSSRLRRFLFSRQVKEKSPDDSKVVNPGPGFGPTDFGSRQDMFFDSRGWLDSDCEDDYYSVKGEFTPSRGSTPNRYFGSLETPQRNGKTFDDNPFPDNRSDASPTEKKKLSELLQVSLSEPVGNESKFEDVGKPDERINGKTNIGDAETNQLLIPFNETAKPKKEKSSLTASCCIPGLVPGIASRKQKTSPSH
ncbi:uncharacterized protein At3g27210 [Phalaenopsis equestris]|uniref:uncharacterized protein At3g27210 n=1 Tax=Phalaenopsis equestris TaxID=78828 RepID=UPI0009E1EB23|nr:uncharacterized protein At3g27210 [Phalaenopsis equestris]XP_020599406.1 uncharacterized protein At3g27210 [Phalaenopsis equestris]